MIFPFIFLLISFLTTVTPRKSFSNTDKLESKAVFYLVVSSLIYFHFHLLGILLDFQKPLCDITKAIMPWYAENSSGLFLFFYYN